mgnify:CR=1 FL=1
MDSRLYAHWVSLQDIVTVQLKGIIPPGAGVILLDYPIYRNIGDLMIHLGTEKWIRQAGLEVQGKWHRHNFPWPEISAGTVILCQGGGNFGDLYPQQPFREKVVRRFPGHRIVFLPQTIHYQDPARLKRSAGVLNAHPNLVLMLRDERSMEIAQAHFPGCQHRLSPDMSAWLHPIRTSLGKRIPVCPGGGVLHLLRRDREKSEERLPVDLSPDWSGDWRELLGRRVWIIQASKALRRLVPARLFASAWQPVARGLVVRCASRFAEARLVVSSRLHGHLLASMLGVPNVVLDNSCGKNSAYLRTWQSGLELARLAADAPPAGGEPARRGE